MLSFRNGARMSQQFIEMIREVEENDDRRQPRRKKPIAKGRRRAAEEAYTLKSIPVKHLLLLPGDCILPLSSMSMQSLIQDLYIKNSSVKCDGNLQLNLSRKVRPFRDIAQLMPLLERIHSPFVPKIKNLLLNEYRDYIDRKRQQRLELTQQTRIRASEYEASLLKYIKSLPQHFYRYQLRGANQDMQMQIKKVGFSQSLIQLLYPQPTDILVQSTPVIFSNLDSYIKYMYHNLLSLVKGGVMDWVQIQLQTVDDITISTRFKNIYYSVSDHLATITLFEISQNAIDSLNYIRQESSGKNVLTKVNPEAERFFNKFYSTKETQPRQMCGYTLIGSTG